MARLNMLHVCGPKLSICCSLVSIWGIVMLAIVGVLMSSQSAAFLEDIPKFPETNSTEALAKALRESYNQGALNCYGAAVLYVACLLFCGVQVFFNMRLNAQSQIQ